MDSLQNLRAFLDANNIKPNEHGDFSFEAFVDYRSNKRNATEICTVRILLAGYDGGKIRLEEKGDFKVEDYHLDFTIQFQKYLYNPNDDKTLEIKGESGKLGKYNVSIRYIN